MAQRHVFAGTAFIFLFSLAPTATAADVAAPTSVPSQPRLGMNLNGPADWNTELPFVDVFRLSRPWISQRQGQPWGKGPELDVDEHGWFGGCKRLVRVLAWQSGNTWWMEGSYFSSVGRWSKWGSWGILQHYDEDAALSPKFTATLRWARACGQPVNVPK